MLPLITKRPMIMRINVALVKLVAILECYHHLLL